MNINNKFLGFFVILILSISIFSSCTKEDIDKTINTDTETFIFDCPDLSLDIGDTCSVDTLGVLIDGLVADNCECEPTATYDCPDLSLNVGDMCTTTSGEEGFVSSACECEPTTTYDCPNLSLNIGDACSADTLGILIDGFVTDNCECEPTATYDCPGLSLNIGDVCYDWQGNEGTVDDNCNCDSPNSVDCPFWGLDIGDECIYGILDPVTMDTIQVQGVLDAACQCL